MEENLNNICSKCFEYYYIGTNISKLDFDKIEYVCPKNHFKTDKFENFLLNNFNQNIFSCSCGNNNIESLNVCVYCNKLFCSSCKFNHLKEFSHYFIPLKEYHITCKQHNFFYIGFCHDCKMNICKFCLQHNNHNIILFDDIELNEEINLIKKNIENAEQYKREIEGLCNDCIKISTRNFFNEVEKLNRIKTNYLNKITEQISFARNISNSYEKFLKSKKLNYQIISNMINTLNFHFNKIYLSTDVKCSGIERMKNNLQNYDNYVLSSFTLSKNSFPLENKINNFNIKNISLWKNLEIQAQNFLKLGDGKLLFKCQDSVFRIYSKDLVYKNIFVTSCKLQIIDMFELKTNLIFCCYKNGYTEIYLLKKDICGKLNSQQFKFNILKAIKLNEQKIMVSTDEGIFVLNQINNSYQFQICSCIKGYNFSHNIFKIDNNLVINIDKNQNIFYYILINEIKIEIFQFNDIIEKKCELLFLISKDILVYLKNENNKCTFLTFDYKNKHFIDKFRTTIFMNCCNNPIIFKISDNNFIYSDNDCNIYQLTLTEHTYLIKSQFYTLFSKFIGIYYDKCLIIDKRKNFRIYLIKELIKKDEIKIIENKYISIWDILILIILSIYIFEFNEFINEMIIKSFGFHSFIFLILTLLIIRYFIKYIYEKLIKYTKKN